MIRPVWYQGGIEYSVLDCFSVAFKVFGKGVGAFACTRSQTWRGAGRASPDAVSGHDAAPVRPRGHKRRRHCPARNPDPPDPRRNHDRTHAVSSRAMSHGAAGRERRGVRRSVHPYSGGTGGNRDMPGHDNTLTR